MRIRFGFCLLPALFLGACSTNGQLATIEPPAPPETFAMLPEAVGSVPFGRDEAPPRLVKTVESISEPVAYVSSGSMNVPATSQNPEVDRLITTYAANYDVPESLVRRVVKRESNFRPGARNGPYYGLMQILPATARSLGFDGRPTDLLDAETNLKYAVKYLKGAYLVAEGDHDQAVRNYARGYYYDAKRKGLLELAGLKGRSRLAGTMVASASQSAPLPPVTTSAFSPAANIASQWETGFVTATNGKSAGLAGLPASGSAPVASTGSRVAVASASPEPVSARMGGEGGPEAPGMGFGPAGSVSTPSLGISTP
jgi:hypothetical protein